MNKPAKSFNLLRSFAALSLVSIALISSISAIALMRYFANRLLERDLIVTMEFIQSVAEAEEPNLAFDRPELLVNPEGLPELFRHISRMPAVVRANVYAPNGKIVWSTDKNLTGKVFADNPDLHKALAGNLVIELKNIEEDQKPEYVTFVEGVQDFVESYLPIWNVARNKVVGVVEIYKQPQALFKTIRDGQRLVWMGAFAAGVFLYLTLFWVVRRASLLIHQQHQQLVESETFATIGELASAVAHSIRNPLASIRTSAELVKEIDTTASVCESSDDIIMEADRMESWVRELLVFSKSGDGSRDLVKLDELIRDTLNGFSRTIEKQSNVKVVVDTAQPAPLIVGDLALLGQMLNSLISNALEAMPKGGQLTVTLRMTNGGKYLQLAVADTGNGIPQDQLETIFKPLQTRKQGGLGLGLTLVKRIVDRHEGNISIDSEVGKGTRVSVLLPTVNRIR